MCEVVCLMLNFGVWWVCVCLCILLSVCLWMRLRLSVDCVLMCLCGCWWIIKVSCIYMVFLYGVIVWIVMDGCIWNLYCIGKLWCMLWCVCGVVECMGSWNIRRLRTRSSFGTSTTRRARVVELWMCIGVMEIGCWWDMLRFWIWRVGGWYGRFMREGDWSARRRGVGFRSRYG